MTLRERPLAPGWVASVILSFVVVVGSWGRSSVVAGTVVAAVVGVVVACVLGMVAAVVAVVLGMVPSARPLFLRQPVRPVMQSANARARMVYFFIALPPKFLCSAVLFPADDDLDRKESPMKKSGKKLSIMTEEY